MKWLHNDKVSLGWAVFVEIAVHALFAFQAFLLGGFIGEIALTAIFGPSGTIIGAWALAIFIFGAAFQAFVLGEYMQEHVQSFEQTSKGNGSYIRSWKQVRWLVAGLEVSSLLFRCIVVLQQGDIRQGLIVAAFGIISLWYAFAQAKVIHASVNRPVEYEIMQAQHIAGKSLVTDALKYTGKMSPEQKARFVEGDVSAVQEVAQNEFSARMQRAAAKREREDAKQRQDEEIQQKADRAKGSATRLLNPSLWRVKHNPPQGNQDFMEAQASDIHQANRLGMKNGSH